MPRILVNFFILSLAKQKWHCPASRVELPLGGTQSFAPFTNYWTVYCSTSLSHWQKSLLSRIAESGMACLCMLWILIWLTFNHFDSKYSCSPKGYPQNGHILWLALLVPGLASQLLEFPLINYRYYWFVEISQVWAFKNVSLMMLNLWCQLDVN